MEPTSTRDSKSKECLWMPMNSRWPYLGRDGCHTWTRWSPGSWTWMKPRPCSEMLLCMSVLVDHFFDGGLLEGVQRWKLADVLPVLAGLHLLGPGRAAPPHAGPPVHVAVAHRQEHGVLG